MSLVVWFTSSSTRGKVMGSVASADRAIFLFRRGARAGKSPPSDDSHGTCLRSARSVQKSRLLHTGGKNGSLAGLITSSIEVCSCCANGDATRDEDSFFAFVALDVLNGGDGGA